jgi:ABC-type multidrug transport system fused ATPase/permease subunit
LDSESELAIKEAISFLHHKITQVIIAHRLSTIMSADQIIVLDNGRIVGIGTHQELLQTSPIYKRLYTLQFQQQPQQP